MSVVRSKISLSLKFLRGLATRIFSRENFESDWSEYTKSRTTKYIVRSTDSIVVDLDNVSVHSLLLKTNAPILLEFTQDLETRRVVVSPSVQPLAYFASAKAPSDRPTGFKVGTFTLTGSPISSLSILGLASVFVVADVTLNYSGY